MKLNTPAKVTVGIATAIVVLGFLAVLLPLPLGILATRGVIPLSEEQVKTAVKAFLDLFNLIALAICALNVLNLALIVFYIAHAMMNGAASVPARIALALGLFTLPFLAMPAYFLIYILPSSPPTWALAPPVQPLAEPVQEQHRPMPRAIAIAAIVVIICLLLIPAVVAAIVLLSLLGPSIGDIF